MCQDIMRKNACERKPEAGQTVRPQDKSDLEGRWAEVREPKASKARLRGVFEPTVAFTGDLCHPGMGLPLRPCPGEALGREYASHKAGGNGFHPIIEVLRGTFFWSP